MNNVNALVFHSSLTAANWNCLLTTNYWPWNSSNYFHTLFTETFVFFV